MNQNKIKIGARVKFTKMTQGTYAGEGSAVEAVYQGHVGQIGTVLPNPKGSHTSNSETAEVLLQVKFGDGIVLELTPQELECAQPPYKSTTHEERYYHFRLGVTPGFPASKFKAATVFARKDPSTNQWLASIALCVMGDTFDRKIGRQVARRKFFLGDDYRYPMAKDLPYHEVLSFAESMVRRGAL